MYTIQRPPLHANFELPTRDELLSLKAGDDVKLIFASKDGFAERMWVTITNRDSIDEWHGTLANDPVGPENVGIRYGDRVAFHPLDAVSFIKLGGT